MAVPGTHCFGYGSLVNRETHNYENCEHSALKNWRRRWSHRVAGPNSNTSLSIEQHSGSEIMGLLAWVSGDQIPYLDKRESGYSKRVVEPILASKTSAPVATAITYVSVESQDGNAHSPILQSYLDAVLKGFLTEFGESGVRQFVETTAGWHTPILNDRHAPLYPRSVKIELDEAELFDFEVGRINGNWIDL